MIREVSADKPTFRTVKFGPGFNVVVADRTAVSTEKDSRNGLGKTTLIEIIHFCLGSTFGTKNPLRAPQLDDWTFSVVLSLGGRDVKVSRNTKTPRSIEIEGDTHGWSHVPKLDRKSGRRVLTVDAWTTVLGAESFGLAEEHDRTFGPSFRMLFKYLARRGAYAFTHPFEPHPKVKPFDVQVSNAFLLGLAWEPASELHRLREQRAALSKLKAAIRTGAVLGLGGKRGELESERVRLQTQIESTRNQLASFRVHPQYREIEKRANELTSEILRLVDENVTDRGLVALYEQSLQIEKAPAVHDVLAVYEAAKVEIGDLLRRRLDDVREFHDAIIRNRKAHLASEIGVLTHRIEQREARKLSLDNQRAELMSLLRSHGALEEYTALQRRVLGFEARLNDVMSQLENQKRFEEGTSALRVEQERVWQVAETEYEDRRAARESAINFFNKNSEALYEAPGKLIIDVDKEAGYTFDVEIERAGAEGIESMKVFCYDLMIAQLWATKARRPNILIHDSTLFNGVDERQVARALQTAVSESKARSFQYICTMNTDQIPKLEKGFSMPPPVLRLTDDTPAGSLLGIRY